jgi:hypothetical protein
VNSAKGDVCSTIASHPSDFVAAKRICGVDANANDVSAFDAGGLERDESLVHDRRISVAVRCRSGDYIKPARGDYRSSKGHITGIYQVNLHARSIP